MRDIMTFLGDGVGGFSSAVVTPRSFDQSISYGPVAAGRNVSRVYVGGHNELAGYKVATDGTLTLINAVDNTSLGITDNVLIDGTGHWLFSSANPLVFVHPIDPVDGTLALAVSSRSITSRGNGVRSFALSPDNRNLVNVLQYTSSATSTGQIEVYSFDPATGNLGQNALRTLPTGNLPNFIAVANFGIPGNPVGYAVTNGGDDTLSLFAGDATGPLVAYKTIPVVAGCHPRCIAAADMDNDGDVDIVVGCAGINANDASDVLILLNNGTADFTISKA